jgi:hypothetical protein
MKPTGLPDWPDHINDIRFRPDDEQPDEARRFTVLADMCDIGRLVVCMSGWQLTVSVPGCEPVEHVFVAVDEDAATDAEALGVWAVVHVLRALAQSKPAGSAGA